MLMQIKMMVLLAYEIKLVITICCDVKGNFTFPARPKTREFSPK